MGCCESREKNLVTYNVDPLPRHCDWNKWTIWKEKFFNIIKNETIKVESSEILGLILKKVIGPYGLDIIAEYFVFHNSLDEQNFDLLLNKLDIFFYLHRFPRNIKTESIKEYINRLKIEAKNFGCETSDIAVKEKIIYDLKQNNFLEIITEIICIRNSFHLKHLNMNEIIFLVNVHENQENREKRENFLHKLESRNSDLRHNNNCCGQYHLSHGVCPANQQRCYKCNDLNHFAKTCKHLYIIDCLQCGINHAENQCPAFGMQCSRCDGLFHFYWKCPFRMITFCKNCGQSHVDVERKCAAFGKNCMKCQKKGHLFTLCPESSEFINHRTN
ncbi:uncharacterized protein LOC127289997 [Leptopilina boulardi]|uniref:uncharacterized protein LOC127289997 n=1 Tax=Leptopilina boulardi TaxID=63433 RepID=UPI0021F60C6D|nr:uncharacterized protein LOC127289997 [Leptopilina boulardi]